MLHARPAPAGALEVASTVESLTLHRNGKPNLVVTAGQIRGIASPDMTFAVKQIEAMSGSTLVTGSGSLALDNLRRPMGTIATETNDLQALLDLVLPQLDMTEQQISGARAVFGLMGKQAKVPILMKDGQLFIGPLKALDLSPLY
jgi:hypothetical protein